MNSQLPLSRALLVAFAIVTPCVSIAATAPEVPEGLHRGAPSPAVNKTFWANTTSPATPANPYGDALQYAANDPDQFNWLLLLEIAKMAPPDLQTRITLPNGTTVSSNNAIWETWADDPFTFPSKPDPKNPPQWENRNKGGKTLEPIQQLQVRKLRLAGKEVITPFVVPVGGGPNHEQTLRNQASFDFIVGNHLYYREGLAAAFKNAVDTGGYSNGQMIVFPLGAIEVKAVWTPITEDKKRLYHWNYDAKGNLYGLTGLHIMSKALPNWTWATWEWAGNTPDQANGNPGRSDWYGSKDSFGCDPHFQAPVFASDGSPSGKPYPSGQLTPELMAAFKKAGFSGEWLTQWTNYRLKGSQTDFVDATGRTTLLGHSITESGFVQTSSCITCHANASVDSAGNPLGSLGFTDDQQSRNGAPNPGWFFDLNTYDPAKSYVMRYYQMDFVWGIFRAKPASTSP